MTLFFELPAWVTDIVADKYPSEKMLYAIPWDLNEKDEFSNGFCVVTERNFLFIEGFEVKKEILIDAFEDFKVNPMSGAGILEAKAVLTGEDVYLARFSMEHLARYATIAQKTNMRHTGKVTQMREEPDLKCLKCGRPYPKGTTICPKCVKKGTILSRLLKMTVKYWRRLAIAGVFLLLISGLNILLPEIYSKIVNQVYMVPTPEAGELNGILTVFALLLISYFTCRVAVAVVSIFRARILAKLSSDIAHDLRIQVFEHIHQMSVGFTNEHKTGDLISRVTNDTTRVKNFIQSEAVECINQGLTLMAVGVYMLLIDWKMALVVILPAPLIVLAMRGFHRKTHKVYRRLWKLSGKSNSVLQDILSGIRVVKTFGTEEKEIERYKSVCTTYKKLCISNEIFWTTVQPLVRVLTQISHLALMLIGGIYILDGKMDAGTLVQFTTYATMIYGPINYMISLPKSIADAVAAAARVFDILDNEPDIKDEKDAVELDIKGDVEYQNMFFGYKSYKTVLKDVNLSVKSGEMIGLVGHSGSGKSTMINLLLRFYDPDSGRITIDGVDLKNISQRYIRNQIGVVLQETFLFSGTIFENVTYSKPDATLEEVIQACKLANAHDFIMKFPDGYDTRVGQNGQTLSGGEKQRIAIARAVIHNPRILILDEATASLDTESEKQVQEALRRLVKNRTTFAIAHRLSTLKFADRLVVLDHGKVAESGTHDELLKAKGIYYGLVLAQLNMTRLVGQEEISEDEYLSGE
ncbi:MAG: ABC transporter ATP-binding protein [Clostridia bacterium]|nr:ABC transporter ATP-binding protein [Clostridia bacterium]